MLIKNAAGFSSCLLLMLLLVSSSGTGHAATLTVSKLCSSSSGTTCFTSIGAAIASANLIENDSIEVEPGTYTESITLKNDLSISGIETARTILQTTGAGPVITANNVTNVKISKLTIVSTGIGIQAGNSGIDIFNNVFWGGSSGTAIQLQGTSSSSQIHNNTFFQNGTAISSTVDITIKDNIFSTNGTALSAVSPLTAFTTVSNNDFHLNQVIGFTYDQTSNLSTNIPNGLHTDPDPKFVNPNATPPNTDLHLKEGSPCIGTDSSNSDMGAFGGAISDNIPFIISGVTVTSQAADSVSLSWLPNNSYVVTNSDLARQGGYNIYYNLAKPGPPYDNKATVASTATNAVISGLTTTAAPPDAPVLNEPGFANETLLISWSTVTAATKYFIHYTDSDISGSTVNIVDAGNNTSYSLHGLINNHHYLITVSAVSQPTYHFAVTAFDYTVRGTNGGTPGESHESAYSSEVLINTGAESESLPSSPKIAFPEAITPHPELANNGCFIATAAYGYYSAPQVQALRQFRDRYLLTNGPGRSFVRWYYRHGPRGAQFILDHPWSRPIVQIALMPLVAGAFLMVHMSLQAKMIVILVIGFLFGYFLFSRYFFRSGGVR